MSSADLAAAAAFTAAGLSLVNVAITVRATRRGNREQWRRDQERPIVARCLTLSDDARLEWGAATVAKQDMGSEDAWEGSEGHRHALKGLQGLTDLRYEVAQLDLLASRSVRDAAEELVLAHMLAAGGLTLAGASQDDESRQERLMEIPELQKVLIEKARADLGLSPGFQVPPNSLLGRTLGRGGQAGSAS